MGSACRTHGIDKYIQILVGKYEGKRPLGTLMSGSDDNIKM